MDPNSIFICFRHTDAGWAGRLDDELTERFPGAVFRDHAIPAGVPWREHIDAILAECSVLLVMIGRNWTSERLFEDGDVVRREVERALARDDVTVIPILFDGAEMPPATELPPTIQELSRRQARMLSDRTWEFDVSRLCDELVDVNGAAVPPPPENELPAAALAMAAAAVAAGLLAWPVAGSKLWPDPSPQPPLHGDWISTTLERVVGIGAHRAILWAFIAAVTLGAAYFALRRTRSAAPAGVVIGLTTGALAGAIGAVFYVLLKEASRAAEPDLLTEPMLNGAGTAVTGLLLAGRFAKLGDGSDGASYRVAGLVAGFAAGALGGVVSEEASLSLGWAIQALVLIAALAALLAAPTLAHGATPTAGAARG